LNLSPNPTADLTTVTFRVPEGGAHVTAVVVDAAGRSVLRMVDAPLPAGERQLIWDGRVESGERAAAGVYFVRVRAGEEEAKGKVVLIR
jgi:flagellar hook assembly protein FlgD